MLLDPPDLLGTTDRWRPRFHKQISHAFLFNIRNYSYGTNTKQDLGG